MDAAKELESELNRHGIKAKAYRSNAADFNQAQEVVDHILKDFETVDVLVNNVGITKDNLLMRIVEEDFDKVIEVNLKSVFNMTKAIQRTFIKQRSGSLIHMSSSWIKRKCRSIKLCCLQSRHNWFFKSYCFRTGIKKYQK